MHGPIFKLQMDRSPSSVNGFWWFLQQNDRKGTYFRENKTAKRCKQVSDAISSKNVKNVGVFAFGHTVDRVENAPNLHEKSRYRDAHAELVLVLYKVAALQFWWQSEQYSLGRLHGSPKPWNWSTYLSNLPHVVSEPFSNLSIFVFGHTVGSTKIPIFRMEILDIRPSDQCTCLKSI